MRVPFHGNLYPATFKSYSEDFIPELLDLKVDEIFGRSWKAILYLKKNFLDSSTRSAQLPLKIAFVVHGYGEHAGRYAHLPSYLGDTFDAFLVIDLYGHGLSPGNRGDCPNFEGLIENLKAAFLDGDQLLKLRFSNLQWTLVAHSMGGFLGSILMREVAFKRIVLSAPFFALKAQINPIKRSLANLITKIAPTLSLGADIDSDILFSDESVKEAFLQDRLRHSRMTPRMFSGMSKKQGEVLGWDSLVAKSEVGEAESAKDNPRILLILSHEDPLVDATTTTHFFERASKGFQTYWSQGSKHEAFNDVYRDSCFEQIRLFLREK